MSLFLLCLGCRLRLSVEFLAGWKVKKPKRTLFFISWLSQIKISNFALSFSQNGLETRGLTEMKFQYSAGLFLRFLKAAMSRYFESSCFFAT